MTKLRAALCRVLATVAFAQLTSMPTLAQEFPSRTIKIIVPSTPGGGFDITARVIAERLGPLLGQGVVVENRVGAGSLAGSDAAAKAAPDGYTLLMGAFANFGLTSGLYPNLPYDPVKDFKPINIVVAFPFVLVARNDLPYKTLGEIVTAARASPGAITYASGGRATGQHVAMVVVEQLNKISLHHVPYRGAMPAFQDVIGGRIDLLFDNVSSALPQVESKSVRAIAVSSAQRMVQLPDVPTIEQAGGGKLEFESWFGLFAPTAIPGPAFDKLDRELAKVVAMPEVASIFAQTGGRMMGLTGAAAQALVRSEVERWSRVVRKAGLTLQQ